MLMGLAKDCNRHFRSTTSLKTTSGSTMIGELMSLEWELPLAEEMVSGKEDDAERV